mmetsp:Transcript_2536/g.7032  ORF Transcript_2536/g.7032 Transcript_2536/m.7032 type:complete len:263 (+) Transcript_2536:336-1124(+)
MHHKVAVRLESLDDIDERREEQAVSAAVEAVDKPRQVGDLADHLQDLRCLDNLRLELRARQCDDRRRDGIEDKCIVRQQLGGSEGGDRIEEERRALLQITDPHEEDSLVNLKPIPSLPIASRLEQRLCAVDGCLDRLVVVKEEGDPKLAEEQVKAKADGHCLRVRLLQCRVRLGVLADTHKEIRFRQVCLTHLRLTFILVAPCDGFVQLRELGSVGRSERGDECRVRCRPELLANCTVQWSHLALLDQCQQLLCSLFVAARR